MRRFEIGIENYWPKFFAGFPCKNRTLLWRKKIDEIINHSSILLKQLFHQKWCNQMIDLQVEKWMDWGGSKYLQKTVIWLTVYFGFLMEFFSFGDWMVEILGGLGIWSLTDLLQKKTNQIRNEKLVLWELRDPAKFSGFFPCSLSLKKCHWKLNLKT